MSAMPIDARVLIAGNPNSGKSTLFNALSGGRARVGNYPGITVDTEVGRWKLGEQTVEVIDVPGTYSLTARSPEEQVAVRAMVAGEPNAVVCVVDATSLQRGLYLPLQLVEAGVPTVVALNMIDVADKEGLRIDIDGLSREFGAPVVGVSASKKRGLGALARAVAESLRRSNGGGGSADAGADDGLSVAYPAALEEDLLGLASVTSTAFGVESPARSRALALWGLLSLGDDELEAVPSAFRASVLGAREAAERDGREVELEIVQARYSWIERAVSAAVRRPKGTAKSWSERIDAILTHRVAGLLVFALVMLLVFEALFRWSEPMIAGIEELIVFLQEVVVVSLPSGPLRDLLVHGVIAGVGNVVVFAPQILMLFLFIGFLEDSGYLARVAFVIDRVMNGVGLHGRAFVPLLSGFACAVPAVMATRTIENRRDRFVTMLALPLMSCSARLPVYLLVVATVFGGMTVGFMSAGALSLLAMYTLSVLFTLAAAAVLRRTVFRGPRPTLVLEMPPYRWPQPTNLWLTAWRRLKIFLVDAGTIILAFTIILWALLSYPRSELITADYEARHAQIVQTTERNERGKALLALEAERSAEQLPNSIAGRLGRGLEPALEPLGFDWRIGVGIIGAFAAREVFISTLGMVFGFGDVDEEDPSLRRALRAAIRPDGTPLLTPMSGLSLMLFFLLAAQCMSTIAAVRRESGSWKWPVLMFVYMTVLAYAVSLIVFQAGRAMGFS